MPLNKCDPILRNTKKNFLLIFDMLFISKIKLFASDMSL